MKVEISDLIVTAVALGLGGYGFAHIWVGLEAKDSDQLVGGKSVTVAVGMALVGVATYLLIGAFE